MSPKRAGTRAFITVSAALLGNRSWVPAGHLELDIVARDLVGLTPANAALCVVQSLERALSSMTQQQAARSAGAAPQGGPQGGLENVPLPGLELSTLR